MRVLELVSGVYSRSKFPRHYCFDNNIKFAVPGPTFAVRRWIIHIRAVHCPCCLTKAIIIIDNIHYIYKIDVRIVIKLLHSILFRNGICWEKITKIEIFTSTKLKYENSDK